VLLNWNGGRDTIECLNSLANLQYSNYQVVVIDNGSSDDSVARIRRASPDVEIFQTEKNLGFAGGCNVGIRYALGKNVEYVWLLNNDAAAHPEALEAMVETAESDPRIAAVGSAIYSATDPKTLLVWGGGHINFILGRSRHFVTPVRDDKIQFLTGASLLLRASALLSVGLLDDNFFMYWEDADYCFRLRRAGWRLAVAGKSIVWHKESASVGKGSLRMDTLFNRSAARFFQKYAPVPALAVWVGGGLRVAKRAIRGEWQRARAIWTSIREAESP